MRSFPIPMTGLPQAPPQVRICPFCGLATEVPHETQQVCIAALQAEVSRMRTLLDQVRPAGAAPPVRTPSGNDT